MQIMSNNLFLFSFKWPSVAVEPVKIWLKGEEEGLWPYIYIKSIETTQTVWLIDPFVPIHCFFHLSWIIFTDTYLFSHMTFILLFEFLLEFLNLAMWPYLSSLWFNSGKIVLLNVSHISIPVWNGACQVSQFCLAGYLRRTLSLL